MPAPSAHSGTLTSKWDWCIVYSSPGNQFLILQITWSSLSAFLVATLFYPGKESVCSASESLLPTWREISMSTQLTVLEFNTPSGADDMLELLKAFQKRAFIELNDAVVVTKDDHQQVHVRQPLGADQGKGAA